MLIRSILEKMRDQNWATLAVELALVVVGILMAFQVDRAYEASQDRALEQRYLSRLHADLSEDISDIDVISRRAQTRIAQIELLESVLREPDVAASQPEEFAHALEQVTWRTVQTIKSGTYDELRSTGRMILIRSERLRSLLADYYNSVAEQQRLGLGEDDQDRFRLETAGLLSGRHLSSIEDPERLPFDMSPEEAHRIALEFSSRHEAHKWLSRLTKYQVLMRRVAQRFHERATTLQAEINSQLTEY